MIVTAQRYRALGQGTVDDTLPADSTLTEFGQQLTDAFTAYAQYQTAQKCLDLNLQRAQQGLPAVDCSTYGTGVNIGVSAGTQNLILIVVAVLAGVYLLPKLMR